MSSGANASPSNALRSTNGTISSGVTPNSTQSRQRSMTSSLVSPSPGGSSASSRGNPSLLIGRPSPQNYRHPTAPRSSSLVTRRRRSSGNSKRTSLASGNPTDSDKVRSSSPLSSGRCCNSRLQSESALLGMLRATGCRH